MATEHKDRLGTTDAKGKRIRIYPAAIKGFWQARRTVFQTILMLVFLVSPFVKVGEQPLLLLDIAHRRFIIGGKLFSAQDAPNLLFFLGAFLFSMALLTALLGRAWCGWACPQTVFIETIFRRIERWVEGDHLQRQKLDSAPLGLNRAFKKSFKWLLFFFCASIITHSGLAYFVGGREMFEMVVRSPAEHPTAFAAVMIMTAIVLFDFGWFREQFCLIACPYGRFQSVMLDEHSVTVAYDAARGEPRRSGGDCVDCRKCVNVCPTGIDIRNGWQFECIACTACIDACDAVMDKIHRPRGLIGYRSEGMDAGKPVRWVRGRVAAYAGFFFAFVLGLVYQWSTHEVFRTEVLRASDVPYQIIHEPKGATFVLNRFHLKSVNMSAGEANFLVQVAPASMPLGATLVQPGSEGRGIASGGRSARPLFIRFPARALVAGKANLLLHIHWMTKEGARLIEEKEVTLVGPRDFD